ncbi:MAG TPA: hypothetical protein VGK24_19610 [Candidatus Angelobacter sp.]|jgi:hypothetical protein
MLTIFLTCVFVLSGQAAQPQVNSGTQQTTDPSQMSLAERAAVARKATAARTNHGEASHPDGPPPLTPEQRGTVRNNAYVNDALHFRITLNQWQPLTAERMARDEDTGRRFVNPEGQVSSPYRVLWVGDNGGQNIALSVVPMPPEAPKDLRQLNESMKKVTIRQLALATDLTESEEPFLLGDATHPFAGFRATSTIHGQHLVQSVQLTLVNGLLMSFTVTGDSDQGVSDALRFLKAALAWRKAGT